MYNVDSFGNVYFPAGVSVANYPITLNTPTHVLVAGVGGRISKVATSQLISNTDVTSVFGRKGDVIALPGDYTSDMIKEVRNLYFTIDRARASISLTALGTSGPATYNPSTGIINVPQYQNEFNGVTTFNGRPGDVVLTALDVTTALTYTPLAVETDPIWTAQKPLYYTKVETQTYVTTQISNLVDSAPTTLDTLNELAAALGDDPNFATTITNLIGTKEPAITPGTTAQYWRGDKTWQTLPIYSLPIASATVLGGIKVGSNLSINATTGILDATFTYTLPTASTTVLGGVKVDGVTITIDANGVISGANTYILPTATATVLGGVKIGAGITITSGVISVSTNYEAPIAAGTTAQYWRGDKSWQTLPIYTLAGLGGVPTTRTLTINGVSFDLSADRSWSINSMVYPGAGIAVSTGSAWGTSITDNSSNWNTAFSDRMKWDGGATGLNAATGRASLGLGTAALASSSDFAAASHTHIIANVTGLQTALDGKQPQLNGTGFVKASGTSISYDNSTYYLASNPAGYITSASIGNGTLTLNVSGNGLSGSTSFTANQSGGSTFTVTSNATTSASANTLVYRDSAADIYTRYFFGSYINTSDNDESSITRFIIKNGDNYHRSATTTVAANIIRGVASGTWSIAITGNAGSITNQANSATITASTGVNANHIVQRDGNGYIYANHINFNTSESENPTISSFFTSNGDGWSRKSSIAHVRNQLGNYGGWITGINSTMVINALGYTPYNSTNPSGYITGINSTMVTNALGYTPYNSSNPSGYITGYTETDTLASVVSRGSSTSGSITVGGNITVSSNNSTGGGIILADDGDIVDLNDGWASMRFSSGVRIYSANRGGSSVISLASNGTISATGDVIAFSSSDRRLKDNLSKIEGSLEKVSKLSGYSFDWNDNQQSYSGHDYGVVAQEVEAIFPELVRTRDNGYKAVKYEKLIPVLIEAIKELNIKISKLEK